MRAAAYRRFGGPDTVGVEEVPRPSLGADDVLIKVHASTVSAADHRARSREVPRGLGLLAAAGIGALRPKRPVLGMDVAGVVEAVGADVTRFAAGDEVIAMLGASFGGHAEYARIRADGAVALKPRTMSFEDAVTLVFGGLTAHRFLQRAGVVPGAEVLVNGASGAVGTAAVQLAKEAGAHVTAVSSSRNRELVLSLGADRVLDYDVADFAAEGVAYDVVLDAVGNASFERVAPILRPGGALLLVVSDLRGVLTARSRSRSSGKRVITGPGPYQAYDLTFLARLAETGRLRPVIDSTYGLDDIVDAHRYVDAGRKRGSVVLRIATENTSRTNTNITATEGNAP